MKKEFTSGVLFLIFVFLISSVFALSLILSSSLASAQLRDFNPEDPLGTNKYAEQIPSSQDEAQNVALSYLEREWTKILTENPAVLAMDDFLNKINFVFVILFNKNYELVSVSLWLVIILWALLANLIRVGLKGQFDLPSVSGIFIGIIISILLAQVYLFSFLADLIIAIVSSHSLWWVRVIFWVVVFVGFIFFIYLSKIIETYFSQNRENLAKEKEKHNRNLLNRLVKGASRKT